ncbi:hypothetical protein GGI07_004150 [Coemansia sp. Benny D115]|nr:hypothetical protein GGI07_004150 [Coemansia sp. Benny D115]
MHNGSDSGPQDSPARRDVSQTYPSLQRLADLVDEAQNNIKQAARQLSKGGTTQDAKVIAQTPPPPIADLLQLLSQLQGEIRAAELVVSPNTGIVVDVLGLRDRQVVSQAIDLVMVFGVQPRLEPGVGVQMEHRVRSDAAALLTKMLQRQSQALIQAWNAEDDDGKASKHSLQLGEIARQLVLVLQDRVSGSTSDVAHILLAKHTADLFAMLLQTAYAPIPPPSAQAPARYVANIETDAERRVDLRRAFTRIYDTTNGFQVLESLTSLLHAAATRKPQPGPRWFMILCNRFLSRVVQRPMGARIAVDFLVANDPEPTAPKMERISRMLLTPPEGMLRGDHLRLVVPQILEMATLDDEQRDALSEAERAIKVAMNTDETRARSAHASLYVLRRLAEDNPEDFALYVARPVLRPLMRWFESRSLPGSSLATGDESEGTRICNNTSDPLIHGLPESSALAGAGARAGAVAGLAGPRAPLIQVIQDNVESGESSPKAEPQPALATGAELRSLLGLIRNLVLEGIPPASLLSSMVAPVFAPLLCWLSAETLSHCKQLERDYQPKLTNTGDTLLNVLVTTLRLLPQAAGISTVLATIQTVRSDAGGEAPTASDWPVFETDAHAKHREARLVWRSSVVCVRKTLSTVEEEDQQQRQQQQEEECVPVNALLRVLGSTKLRGLIGDLFVTLLREQQALRELLAQSGSSMQPGLARRWWLVSQTTLATIERFGPAVLTKHADVLAFIFDTLEHSATSVAPTQQQPGEAREEPSIEALIESIRSATTSKDSPSVNAAMLGSNAAADTDADTAESLAEEGELVMLALMLLGQVMEASESQLFASLATGDLPSDSGARSSDADLPRIVWDAQALRHLRAILAQLRRLETQGAAPVARLASQVKLQVAMVLALQSSTGQGGERTDEDAAAAATTSGPGSGDPSNVPGQGAEDPALAAETKRFLAALHDVKSDLVPVRAHGVIELRNLVLSRSPALKDSERLDAAIGVFVQMARSADDSFLYLNAIRGLSALADTQGSRFIPQLVQMYQDSKSSLEERLRVGEALLQSVQRAGLMLGEYAPTVVPPLLHMLQSAPDSLSRAVEDQGAAVDEEALVLQHSALSVLSMAAETSALALQRWVGDITATLDDLLLVTERQRHVESVVVVRRAAVAFWLSLLRGYGPRVSQLIEPTALRTIYAALRRVAEGGEEEDELTRWHAEQAVGELDEAVRERLFKNYLA